MFYIKIKEPVLQAVPFNTQPEDPMRLAIVDDESVYRNHIAELINVVYGAENVSSIYIPTAVKS